MESLTPTKDKTLTGKEDTDTVTVVKEETETSVDANVPSGKVPAKTAKGYPLMGTFWERLVAYILDVLILWFISWIVGLGIAVVAGFFGLVIGGDLGNAVTSLLSLLNLVVGLGIGVFYYGWFVVNKAQTPGAMIMKLKILSAESLQNPTWGQAIIRYLVSILSNIVFYLGYLWYFMSPKRQTWHDSAAGLYVVKVDEQGNPLMTGPESYKSEPVKTFAPCGCWLIVTILLVATIIMAAGALVNMFPSGGNTEPSEADPYDYMNYKYDTDYNEEDLNEALEMFNEEMEKQLQEYEGMGIEDLNEMTEEDIMPQQLEGMACGSLIGVECPDGYTCEEVGSGLGFCKKTDIPTQTL